MAADRITVHVSWIEDDEELIRPLTSRLEKLQDELGFQLEFTRHPLGPGLDTDKALDSADIAVQPELLTRAADDGLPQSLRRLWASDGVRSVVEGDGVPARLTEDAVRALVGLAPRRDAERTSSEGNGARTVRSVS
jgi:hypothetical protein